MTVFAVYIFNRNGVCLYYQSWNQPPRTPKEIEDNTALVFGILFSLKAFVNSATPKRLNSYQNEIISSFSTSDYKLHFLEIPSGLRIAMTTDPNTGASSPSSETAPQNTLRSVYQLYVNLVVKNPLHTPGTRITETRFNSEVAALVEALPFFRQA